ncbi:L-aspartate oxidase [Synechococcus sp. PCC 7336]|uniref:L-aspartate oxidase n=1 Tax=Synechococcus sp. PCC 7336 TaxID=195250 RepID=UPI00034A89F3|nr:L-aspartate oxidase [Synechococcus sp. PCC 7336]
MPPTNAGEIALSLDFAGTWDVAIVGSGAAGLYAALSFPSDWRVLLLTKETLPTSSSSWAQGGIAAVTEPDDSPQLHAADTLRAGVGLCEPAAVEVLVREASDRIEELLRWGVEFDRARQQGTPPPNLGKFPYRLAVTLEAAHSRRRVLHVADATGKALVQRLLARVLDAENITVWERSQAIDLWMADGRCCGFYGLQWDESKQHPRAYCVRAGATVLATGGAGQLYTHTTNPPSSTGDGQAIAWRAGAALRDLEFVQFHPTALMAPGAPRFLISEAVRGEGAYAIDARGERFLFHYHPDGELAPRDVVSRAIFRHLQQRSPDEPDWVWLDMRHLDPKTIRHRFPTIATVCRSYGIDVYTQPVPVAPAAHYWMGGVETDLWGRTTIDRLYAVGEVASTGVHGANRLASNSLLECLVFAHRLAAAIVAADCRAANLAPLPLPNMPLIPLDLADPDGRTRSLATLMWDAAGICRHAKCLQSALAELQQWSSQTASSLLLSADTVLQPLANIRLYRSLELRNLMAIARLVLASAAFRRESRGGHYRDDFPRTDDLQWQVHTRAIGSEPAAAPLATATPSSQTSPSSTLSPKP